MQELIVRSPSDISNFIAKQPTSRRTWFITFVALGGIFVDAYDFASLGVGIVQLRATFGLTPFEVGWTTAMMAIGAGLGGVIGGGYIDKMGRFKMLLINVALLVVSAIGAGLSTSFTMLLIFRFSMGVGVGLDFPVALSYVAEVANTKSKTASVGFWQVMWYVAASCSGFVILPFYYGNFGDDLWRVAIGFGAVPALIVLVLRYFYTGESPMWAAQHLSLNAASRVVAKTYGITVRVLAAAPDSVRSRVKPRIVSLFNASHRKATLLASMLCMTQSIEYFSVGFNIPSISEEMFGRDFVYAILGAILFNLFGIAGSSAGVMLGRRVGVRWLAICGYIVVALSLLALGLFRGRLPITTEALLLGAVILGHSVGPGQGTTLAALSYPTEMRGLGTGWSQGMVRVGSIVGFFLFPILMATAGMAHTLLWVAVVPVIGLISALLIHWDPTRGDSASVETAQVDADTVPAADGVA